MVYVSISKGKCCTTNMFRELNSNPWQGDLLYAALVYMFAISNVRQEGQVYRYPGSCFSGRLQQALLEWISGPLVPYDLIKFN